MIHLRAWLDDLRDSLFFVPVLFVVAGFVLGHAMTVVDSHLSGAPTDVPLVLRSTVESGRAVLTTIAGATITFAGIAFSVALLTFQLASSQYSPRVIQGMFRDPFNKRVMGIVVGTFTYCLMVLRAVRSSVEEDGDSVIPNLSIALALALGIGTILALVAFINHSAHAMDVGRIIAGITDQTIEQAERTLPAHDEAGVGDEPGRTPDEPGTVLTATTSGWVQQVDRGRLRDLVPPGGTVRLEVAVGGFVIHDLPLVTVWPEPEDMELTRRKANRSLDVGPTRSPQQDLSYGFRQLADIALKALSPGVNDPTTAVDCIHHLGAMLQTILTRDLPPREERDDEGRRLLLPEEPTHEHYVLLAFEQIRRAATPQPAVAMVLLDVLGRLARDLTRRHLTDRVVLLREQADLLLADVGAADHLPEDVDEVRRTHTRWFAGAPTPT